ncbi:MAG: MFS transporter [Chloroflexi bacterium]|nr:MFS transporter [Chloroflexota bacterium]
MLTKVKTTYQEFPGKFWVLATASFIDSVGGTMIFPFFALYVTQKFNVGMTQAGILIAIFSVSGFIGSILGGALTDKFGRRGMVIFGLVFSALSSLTMGFVGELSVFYSLAVAAGLLSNIAGPARQAMVADLLPEEKRSEGFGVLRVSINLAWIIGPTIGGFLAARSYLLLFILDAITSVITAVIVYKLIPETKPEATEAQTQESFLSTLVGYRKVAADKIYVGFLVVSMIMLVAYQQIYNTLSVYLRDVHEVPTQGYGLLMSLNATTVVLFQFGITRKFKHAAPMLAMALGSLFYMVGLTMYGAVSNYGLFIAAMILITVGEMVVIPVGQTLVANFAPVDMRGRYMAIYGLAWTIPSAVGPWAAGLLMDNYDPDWVWYAAGIFSALAATGFYLLHHVTKSRFVSSDVPSREQTAVSPA